MRIATRKAGRAVRTALKALPVLAEGPVLDLGCGSGRHLTELRKVNPRAFGLDLSKHLLELLKPPCEVGSSGGICGTCPSGAGIAFRDLPLVHALRLFP